MRIHLYLMLGFFVPRFITLQMQREGHYRREQTVKIQFNSWFVAKTQSKPQTKSNQDTSSWNKPVSGFRSCILGFTENWKNRSVAGSSLQLRCFGLSWTAPLNFKGTTEHSLKHLPWNHSAVFAAWGTESRVLNCNPLKTAFSSTYLP